MFMTKLLKFLKSDRRGAITLEYFVLLAFLGLGAIAVIKKISTGVDEVGGKLEGSVRTLAPSPFPNK